MLREWLGERCEGIVALGSRIVVTYTVGVDGPLPHVGLATRRSRPRDALEVFDQ
jgi:hypothetical protein